MTEKRELTDREREILELVATGASNRQIAQQLHISSNTVKVHLRNIFEKLGVSSRTEATLYAVRNGLVEVEGAQLEGSGSVSESPSRAAQIMSQPWIILVLSIVILVLISFLVLRLIQSSREPDSTFVDVAQLERWTELAHMPTARSELALAAYEGQIYAIAGKTTDGVTGVVERYDPQDDHWETIKTDKPAPVDGVEAVIVGGKIYIPGGRTQSGQITEVLEVFDPTNGVWEQREPLPIPVSDYALTSYEGKLYLFGGWDGNHVLGSTLIYDPDEDKWRTGEEILTPRAGATAVNSSTGILVMGGWSKDGVLDVSEVYQPAREASGAPSWMEASSIPNHLMSVKAWSFGDIIYLLGADMQEETLQLLEYLPQDDSWQQLATPFEDPWLGYQVVGSGLELYVLGGREDEEIIDRNVRFKAIFTLAIPIVQ